MKKSQLKAIIRECIEEISLDEKRGKGGIRPSNSGLRKDINTMMSVDDHYSTDEDAKEKRAARKRIKKTGTERHIKGAIDKDNREGQYGMDAYRKGVLRYDPLEYRKASKPMRSGPRKGLAPKDHIEKRKIQLGSNSRKKVKPKLPK